MGALGSGFLRGFQSDGGRSWSSEGLKSVETGQSWLSSFLLILFLPFPLSSLLCIVSGSVHLVSQRKIGWVFSQHGGLRAAKDVKSEYSSKESGDSL